jgi:hypothetical protein
MIFGALASCKDLKEVEIIQNRGNAINRLAAVNKT